MSETETIRHVVATGTAYQEILKTAEGAGSDLDRNWCAQAGFQGLPVGPECRAGCAAFNRIGVRGSID